MQTKKEELEDFYKTNDPFAYQTNPEDIKRKQYLLHLLDLFGPNFKRALDIGCGEAWITQHLRAPELWGFEISEIAASRFPFGVKRAYPMPEGKFDLVISTGTMYGFYDHKRFMDLIRTHSSGIIMISNIAAWEHIIVKELPGKELFVAEFPYREYRQKVRIHDVTLS